MSRRAVFVDRDGVLNELVPDPVSVLGESPLTPSAVTLVAGVGRALRSLQNEGYAVVIVSNQPAAAKGTVTVAALHAVHARVLELLADEGVVPAASRICFHHPAGTVPELAIRCDCRKPAPGMLLEAAAELGVDLAGSWMVGDTDTDVQAGRAAGCRTILIENPGSAHKRRNAALANRCAPDLRSAVDFIVRETR